MVVMEKREAGNGFVEVQVQDSRKPAYFWFPRLNSGLLSLEPLFWPLLDTLTPFLFLLRILVESKQRATSIIYSSRLHGLPLLPCEVKVLCRSQKQTLS
jgi:hypothetical protein